jgi:FlaG/FlaF family flagellin (archaellin)
MQMTKNLSRRLRRSKRAISPIIAILLIIVITVAASLVAYAWIMGYIGDISSSAGDAIQIQSIARTEAGEITAYVQNVGQTDVYITNAYLDDIYDPNPQAYPEMVATPLPYRLNTTTTVPIILSLTSLNDQVKVKIVTSEGTFMELTKKFTSSSGTGGGGITPTPEVLLDDDFNRADSNTVGNGWNEIDSDPSAEARILNNRLDFNSADDAYQPLVYHPFSQETTGKIAWTFTFNFERTGSEGTYEVFMQLGQGLTNAPAGDTAGVAVNLKWGGTNNGFSTHEGFGYYDGATVTQIGVVSGSGGDANIEVIADLDTKTFDLTITGPGLISGTGTATGIPFDNNVNIDTVMIYLNQVSESNFSNLEIDNVRVEHTNP